MRLIVPFAPGGTTDVLARLVGQELGEALGQQFLVENRPGAGGNIGTEIAVKAAPDGYTLLMSFDGTLAINPSTYRKLAFDPQRDLAPVASVAQVPLLIVVHPGVAAQTVAEFVALAKASPGRVNYSSAGHGSTGHLTGELFKARAGIDIVHIGYKGGGQAVQDLLGGQIQMVVTALPTVEGHLKGGKLRALAFTSAQRVPGAPEVPTLAESGFAGFEVVLLVRHPRAGRHAAGHRAQAERRDQPHPQAAGRARAADRPRHRTDGRHARAVRCHH